MKLKLITIIFLIAGAINLFAQPIPGDIFRDYIWTIPDDFEQDFLRVIGDGDYREPNGMKEVYPKDQIKDGWILFNQNIDLENAVKAELQVELVLSHDGTSGFAAKINENGWHFFQMPDAVPEPKCNYLQHSYPVVPIPLDEIKAGTENEIRFRVDSLQRFNKPQHILYGFQLRIYYNRNKEHALARIKSIKHGNTVAENQELELTGIKGEIANVQYLGFYKGINWEGDGKARQWHYTFYRGNMQNNIGSSVSAPYKTNWNTSWLPDQEKEMQLSAWVTNTNGITYFLPPIKGLHLKRDYSVELCMPFEIPEGWATREKVFEEKLSVFGNLKNAEAFQLAFTSWSPGYLNGIFVNDWQMPTFEACKYCYGAHIIESKNVKAINTGTNIISTGLTPRVNGKMVHGTEIQFPGIMLSVKYKNPPVRISEVNYKNTPHFKVKTSTATYFIENQSGGCSSMLDRDGKDWVNYRKTGKTPGSNSADSDFRGIPNLVHREPGNGIGHPGFNQCNTEQVSENELVVKSKSGKWQFRWKFYARFAELLVEKTDESHNYWFLYEGTANGQFNPGSHYWGNNVDGLRTDMPSLFKKPVSGNWQWVFFGDKQKSCNTTLFIVQDKSDSLSDYFSYMGNVKEDDILSKDGMNVFGFGRGLNTSPELKGQNRFYFGFFPKKVMNKNALDELTYFIEYITEKTK